MSEALTHLRAACYQLGDGKAAQRKKGLETIRKELMKDRVKIALDDSSDKKHELNWNVMFRCIQQYISSEADLIQKMKVGSTTTARTQDKRKKDLGSLFRWIIKVANGRKERLKCDSVVEYLFTILSDEFLRNAFGEDAVHVLYKNILRSQKYVTVLKQKDWNDLIKKCTNAFRDPDCSISKDALGRTIHALIAESVGQSVINQGRLFRFFSHVIPDMKNEKARSLACEIFSALSKFSFYVMNNCRRQLCNLGEHVFPTILYIWNRNPSTEIKCQLIEFMRIQLTVHHPLGATSAEQGSYASDPDTWKVQVSSLYKAIYEEIRQISSKAKLKTTSGKGFTLDANLAALATDVFYQMFTCHSNYVFEVTQLSTCSQFGATQGGTAPKRRRVESCWKVLSDILSEQASTLQGIAWLQVLTAILKKYPDSLPKEELPLLLNTLLQARLQCKRSEVQTWLLQCLSALAVSQIAIQPRPSIADRLKPLWNKVWSTGSSAVRSVSPHGTQNQAYNLLCTLLRCDLVTLDKDQWRLFIPGITQPTSASVSCLAICLQKTSLPENYQALVDQTITDTAFPLRCQLVRWLISVQDSDDYGDTHILQKTLSSVPANLFADVLVSLLHRTPSIDEPIKSKTYVDDDLEEAARLYLKSDFICNGGEEEKATMKCKTQEGPKRIHEEVLKMVLDSLTAATNQLIQAVAFQESCVEYVLKLAVVIQKVLMKLLKGQIMTNEMISDSDLYKQFKKLLQNAWETLLRVCKKRDFTIDSKLEVVSSVVSTWSQLYIPHADEKGMSAEVLHVMTECKDATPWGFIDHIFKIASSEILNPVRQRSMGGPSQHAILDPFGGEDESTFDLDIPDAGDSLDDGFGDVDTGTNNVMEEDDRQVKARQSILSEGGLLPRQQLTIKCLNLIAHYSCIRSLNPDVLSGTTSDLVEKLIEQLKQKDKVTSFGLQSRFCVIEVLVSSPHIHMNDSVAEGVLQLLREMASTHRKNHEVCAKILKQIRLIFRHLAVDENSSEDMDEAKLHALDLLNIFMKLNTTDMYTPAVRMEIVKCIETLIQLDPNLKWSVWQENIGNSDVAYKSVIADFPEFLLDPDHRIQMFLAQGIQYLFQFSCTAEPGTVRWFSKDVQNSSFDLIYQKAQEAMPQQEQDTEEWSDEFHNRSSALLHMLATIAKSSVISQKKTVFALVQTVKLNSLATTHISRVISSIAFSLKYPSPLDFLLSHLGFLISQWLDVGYHVFDFPYQLFNCNTRAEFFTKYHHCIIPFLVMCCNNLEDVDSISKEIQTTTKQLLQDDFPQCIVHILPLFAHVPQDDEAASASHIERKAQATACFHRLEEVLGKKEIDQLIQRNLDIIVVELLLMLYDESNESDSGCSPEPNPPYFLAYTVQATLDYLTACHGNSQKTLISLLSRSPDSIQNILLSLQMNLQQSHCSHEKQRLLVSYRFFVTLLLKELDTGLGGAWAFVLHDTIHTLLQVVSSCTNDNSCLLALGILHQICQVALNCCHLELGKLAVAIVGVLIPLANQDRNASLSTKSVALLNLLVIEGSTKLADSLQYVDPLPEVLCLSAARKSLDAAKYKGSNFNLLEEINHFLICDGQNNNLPTLESLKLLHQKLSKNREEMKQLLMDDQESIGNLISSLVNICRQSGNNNNVNNAIQQQAACCLGEIGPVELCAVSLKSHQSDENKSYATAVKVYKEEPRMIRRCIIIHLLKTYLTDVCVATKRAAVECLKCLLATPSGIAFREDYVDKNIDKLFDYLHPFRPHKQKRTKLPAQTTSEQEFANILNDATLWNPESTNHDDWIRQLTCSLIDSGGVQDEFLRLLKPVCKVKVEFAEQILAFLIHDILATGNAVFCEVLSNHIQSFFARHCGEGNHDSRAPTPMSIDMSFQPKSKRSTLVMLQVVHYLRTQEKPSTRNLKSTAWDNNFWLELDYLVVAMAAKACSAHFTCILYTEIWCDQQRNGNDDMMSDRTSAFETLSCLSGDHGINVQQLLLDSYCNIGEPDGIYGYGAGRLTDTSARIHTYEHEGRWMKALSAYDSHLQQEATGSVSGLLKYYLHLSDGELITLASKKERNLKSTAWDNNFWLELDYLVVAMAAKACSAHFTCILYTEIWCDQQRNGRNGNDDMMSDRTSAFETLSCLSGDHGINVRQLLLDSYRNIGEPDGIYGYGAGRLTDTSARIHTYEHEGRWMKALSAYDSHLQQEATGSVSGLLQVNHFIVVLYLRVLKLKGGEVAEHQYEAAWRLGQWDMQFDNFCLESSSGFHESVYKSLTAMKNKDENTFKLWINKAEGQVLHDLCHVSLESNQNVYPLLCELQMLNEVQNSMHYIKNNRSDSVSESWKDISTVQDLDFEFVEPVLAIRSSILDIAYTLNPGLMILQDVMSQHMLSQSELARKAGRYHIAERAVAQLSKLNESRNHDDCRKWVWQLEKANVFWGRGEQDTAKHLLKICIGQLAKTSKKNEVFKSIYPQALGIYGQWLAETHTESPNTIMDDYLEKAVIIYDSTNNTSSPAMQAYLSLARFADTHYQNICNYMKSKVFESKQALLTKCRADLQSLKAMGDNHKSKYQRTLEKQKEIDETELEAMADDKANYLHKAVNWYLKCLTCGDQNDIRMFRVCSLWFDNASDADVNNAIECALGKLESRKFLPLMPQLAARMTTKEHGRVNFQKVLQDVIKKTVVDHPHHTLPIILALANANKDTQLTNRKSAGGSRGDKGQTVEERMAAAQNLLTYLETSSTCSDVIRSQNRLSLAYINLAYLDTSLHRRETKPIKIPSNQSIMQIKDLEHVAVPTLELPVDPTCRYDNIVYVKDFEPTFKLAGGVNLPKILTCIGSNGRRYTQLVKGRDDLRQDAVMQQVFGLVNSLLMKDPETKKRKLHVRRYKVIPLSQRSGLLEWCEGTMPIGQYLIGPASKSGIGAHKRYRPNDWTALDCRKKMTNAHDKAQKYATFQQVLNNFKPVFRYFFMEKFVDPNCWFERRLAYTRSVATSSIVGYVVGLGDRHVQNILIDCNTAELVHIDLGVAFEQGKILYTPETVPFRLTRDIEDGMGVASVEGVFRRCCEKTMEVMHNSQEALLTILEVLLYDPLYDWTISPLKARNIQQTDPDASMLSTTLDFDGNGGSSTEEVNKMAKRALLRLRQKLQGEEDGVVLSVSGQVSRLIQEARDFKNLSGLFPGWQPWL
ncbi:serine-protein kinase ATM-like [Anneissia japonica]|uniref:serine-protein kinase ATM-like n=1 Tax=Anneissia japonica TaxID=1529436 RepID=UPI001425B54A|nr:serine-protein kinase ATM-like [Anneissia japonica]